ISGRAGCCGHRVALHHLLASGTSAYPHSLDAAAGQRPSIRQAILGIWRSNRGKSCGAPHKRREKNEPPQTTTFKSHIPYFFPQIGYIYVMPKSPLVAHSLPPVAASALRQLGENLAIARARRRESQRAWAQRIGVSVP